jgi:hypothetical protein
MNKNHQSSRDLLLRRIGEYFINASAPTSSWISNENEHQAYLFQAISKFEDQQLSEAILRLILKLAFEAYDENTYNSIDKHLKEPVYGMIPFPNIKSMKYCWELAKDLVRVIEIYCKSNKEPNFDEWKNAIPHNEFSEFVISLYLIKKGVFTQHFHNYRIIEWINETYGTYDYEGYDAYNLAIFYISYQMDWISRNFPSEKINNYPHLIQLSADLTKYSCINLSTSDPMLNGILGLNEILSWNPSISLPCLCKSYNCFPTDEDVFMLDDFWDSLYAVSEKLPGQLNDQLIGVFYTHTDKNIREGALNLLSWEDLNKAIVDKLKREILENYPEYKNILPKNN